MLFFDRASYRISALETTLWKKITEWDGHVFRLPYQGTEKEDLGQGESHSVLVTRRMYWRGRDDNLLLQLSHTTWVAGEGIRMEGAWVCDPEGLTQLSTFPLSSYMTLASHLASLSLVSSPA